MTTTRRREQPSADVFARTVPMVIERHYFGEHKSASLSAVQTAADKAVLTLGKRLLRMPETAAIRQRDTRFREWLNTVATPFRASVWLVPVGMVERVDAAARVWQRERQALVEDAGAVYPAQVEAMRAPLGPLFNPLDYPSAERFKAHYWVEWRFVDFGVPNVLREVRAEVFERERVKLEAAGAQAREMIEQHLAGSLLKITDHLVGLLQPRANGRRPGLRDGALDDLLVFLDTVAARDVTGFRDLQAVTARLRQLAHGLSVEDLRTDDDLRGRTAAAFAEARDAVAALVVDEERRAIRFREDEEVA